MDILETVAMTKAIEAWQSRTSHDYSADGLEAACQTFHEHMAIPLQRALFEAVGLLEFTSILGAKSPVVMRGREVLNGWRPED